MTRLVGCCTAALLMTAVAASGEIRGEYMEARTCDVYTGPCFANAEIGLCGQEAILAWSISEGEFNGVDLTGLKVVMAVKASDTLGFGGGLTCKPEPIRSIVMVDSKANESQKKALVAFVKKRAGRVAGTVVRVDACPIEWSIDYNENDGKLKVGDVVDLETRKLMDCDCICTNEVIFYPPLADVTDYAAAYALQSRFGGKGLGTRWSLPDSRSAFVATFKY
ncbi:MAG: DUF1326 domain-containing protein [Planctomycetales bacterium]